MPAQTSQLCAYLYHFHIASWITWNTLWNVWILQQNIFACLFISTCMSLIGATTFYSIDIGNYDVVQVIGVIMPRKPVFLLLVRFCKEWNIDASHQKPGNKREFLKNTLMKHICFWRILCPDWNIWQTFVNLLPDYEKYDIVGAEKGWFWKWFMYSCLSSVYA